MAGPRPRKPSAPSALPASVTDAIEQLSPEQLRATLAQVLDLAAAGQSSALQRRRAKPSRTSSSLTVRVDLVDADPQVWRRLELPSALTLEQVHGVLQAAFGWTDSHLHRFALGESVWDADEVYVGWAELEEVDGEQVVLPDRTVRLDEVLSEPGHTLRYVYDYGDNWELLLTVEQTQQPSPPAVPGELLDARARAQAVRLLDGHGLAPPEDSGGIWAWNDDRPDTPLDRAAVEAALDLWRSEQGIPPELLALLAQVTGSTAERPLRELLDAAELQQARSDVRRQDVAGSVEEVPVEQAQVLVGRFLWLLDKVGEGVTLTSAGWLPPRLVNEAMTQLWPPDTWIGKANREDMTEPVRRLRATAQRLGLIRVLKGRLLLTRAGAAVRHDPLALFTYVADRAAGRPRSDIERLPTLLRLLELAAGGSSGRGSSRVAEILSAAGWRAAGGGPVSPFTVVALAPQLDELLDCLSTSRRQASPTAGLDALARRALRQA